MTHAIAQAISLIVVNIVMMDMIVAPILQKNGGVTPAAQFAVVHFKETKICRDAAGIGQKVVILMLRFTIARLRIESTPVMFQTWFWVRPNDAQPGYTDVWPNGFD